MFKKSVLMSLFCLFLFGCSSGASAPAATSASSATVSVMPAATDDSSDEAAAKGEVSYLLVENLLHTSMKDVYDDYHFERDGDLISVFAWRSPIGQVCEQIKSGDTTLEAEYLDVRDSLGANILPILTFAEDEGIPLYIDLYVVDERDEKTVIFYYSDGVCMRDASGLELTR